MAQIQTSIVWMQEQAEDGRQESEGPAKGVPVQPRPSDQAHHRPGQDDQSDRVDKHRRADHHAAKSEIRTHAFSHSDCRLAASRQANAGAYIDMDHNGREIRAQSAVGACGA